MGYLTKYLHDWVPLAGAKHTNKPVGEKHCPVCHQEEETFWHVWECKHPGQQQFFDQLYQQISKPQTLGIDPHLLQMLQQKLLAIHKDTPDLIHFDHYPVELHILFMDQQRIG